MIELLKLLSLYYKGHDEYHPLPDWAKFYLKIGFHFASFPIENERIVLGLALPTRIMSSSLIASGYVFRKMHSNEEFIKKRIEQLKKLKPGTSINYRIEGNRLMGILEAIMDGGNQCKIKIRFGKNDVRILSLIHHALQITPTGSEFKLPKFPIEYSIEEPGEFLLSLVGKKISKQHLMINNTEILMIGKKSVIEQEVKLPVYTIQQIEESKYIEGTLQEILRIEQFSGANKTHRSRCISSLKSNPHYRKSGRNIPKIVIFDGSVAYIKFNHLYVSSHQIVLLDRTDHQFFDAINLINQNYNGNFQ